MKRIYPPGPPNDLFGFRHLAAIRTDLVGFGSRNHQQFGDVAWFRMGPFDCYQLLHPEHIHEVLVRKARKLRKPTRLKLVLGRFEGRGLVVSDGDLWSRQRRLVQPAFSPTRLHSYVPTITTFTQQLLDRWPLGSEIPLMAEMRRLMIRIVAQTLFSVGIDEAEPLAEAVDEIQRWSMTEFNRVFATPSWLPLLGQPKARRAIRYLHNLVDRIIGERRAAGRGGDDLLGRLLDAVDSEGDKQGMTNQQLRDEIVTLLLAGHETTAIALVWAVWLLAQHPEVQERLRHDVRAVLGDRPAQASDLPHLGSAERVFKEAMRLYPPVYFFSREVAEETEVAGFAMRPGSQIFLYPYLTQRDARWFAEPERFDPERFAPQREEQLPPCAWFPFGAGPRACVGRGLAMAEGTLILATLAQQCRMELASGQPEPELQWELSLHPREEIRVIRW